MSWNKDFSRISNLKFKSLSHVSKACCILSYLLQIEFPKPAITINHVHYLLYFYTSLFLIFLMCKVFLQCNSLTVEITVVSLRNWSKKRNSNEKCFWLCSATKDTFLLSSSLPDNHRADWQPYKSELKPVCPVPLSSLTFIVFLDR